MGCYAKVTLDNGAVLEFGMDSEHPDALDMCVSRVKDLWREAVEEEP